MSQLQQKIALITGATGGIGRALVEIFCPLFGCVLGTGRCGEKLESLEKMHSNFVGIKSSINTPSDVMNIMNIVKQKGELALLINNAGLTQDALSYRMSVEQLESVLRTNLTMSILLCKEAVLMMRHVHDVQKNIINITSVVGHTGNVGQVNYAASKAGLHAATKSMAREYARFGVRVNAVAPGFIKTAMTDVIPDAIRAKILDSIPLKEMGSPMDVAYACEFLSSEKARYMTGSTLHVNGGMYCN